MELKQKKTIFWSVVITLFISTFLLIWFESDGVFFDNGIWNGLFILLILSLMFLSLPSVLLYRILIGKIPINTNNMGYDYYIVFILMLVLLILFYTERWIGNIFRNPPEWLLPVLVVIILVYGIHKILKHFVFEFKKEESDNDKEYDRILNQIKEELKKEDEEFLNQLKDGLKNIDTKDWKF